ncbi:MAG: hypothetical protein Q9191_002470 [Dirinaria sp. TL-2023a]
MTATLESGSQPFSVESAREKFPALAANQVFFDNAGGSQVLGPVIDSISTYLHESNVQLGASYKIAEYSNQKYAEGYEAAAKFINAGTDEIVIGPSTTQLFANLSQSLQFPPRSEIILSKIDHEANISAWVRMAGLQNLVLKWWVPDDNDALRLTPSNLRPLMSDKTVFVACTHASNILGTIHDIRAIADEVHKNGALLCVDGVALAPHRGVDVKVLGVDFYSLRSPQRLPVRLARGPKTPPPLPRPLLPHAGRHPRDETLSRRILLRARLRPAIRSILLRPRPERGVGRDRRARGNAAAYPARVSDLLILVGDGVRRKKGGSGTEGSGGVFQCAGSQLEGCGGGD